MPITGSQKALMYARSGLARSGATRSDYYQPFPIVRVNAIDRTALTEKSSISIVSLLNEQMDTAGLTVFSFVPMPGQPIVIASGAADNRVFSGTILRAHQKSIHGYAKTFYDIECVDWSWTLNKRRAFKIYPAGTLANLAAADLMTTYHPTFGIGKIKGGAPALTGDQVFRGTPVMDALQQLAQTAGWHVYPDYDQVVHFFDTEAEQSPAPLQVGNVLFDNLDYSLDLSQIQTRVYGVGGGSSTTTVVAVGATTIPVDECGWYSGGGGTALHRGDVITYTGRSASSGPGDLTGVTGITAALLQGDVVNVFVKKDDAAAQAALAALIGDDGIREGWIEDGRWSLATTDNQAQAQLASFKTQEIRGSYTSYDKLTKVGKNVTITLAARGISTTVTLQRVTRTLANPTKWWFQADFAVVWSDLIDILARVVS
jgi:hypothetical protein